jgi:hypothetical protein
MASTSGLRVDAVRWRPVLLLGVPVGLLVAGIALGRIGSSFAPDDLVAPAAMAWTIGGRAVDIRVERTMAGEIERFRIVFAIDGSVVKRTEFEIDRDMFGGGFVGGLDVDRDGDLELVLATRAGPHASRVLAPDGDGIVEQSFDALPDSAWARIRPSLDRLGPMVAAMLVVNAGILWLLVGALAYAVIGIAALVRRLQRRG